MELIKLTENQIKILGIPNFACAQQAKLLIACGVYEDKESKAEYEQAVFIHWASELLTEHGQDWSKEGNKVLKKCAEQVAESKKDV
jgi:hypothetical protein